jgi:hypothetical protein
VVEIGEAKLYAGGAGRGPIETNRAELLRMIAGGRNPNAAWTKTNRELAEKRPLCLKNPDWQKSWNFLRWHLVCLHKNKHQLRGEQNHGRFASAVTDPVDYGAEKLAHADA